MGRNKFGVEGDQPAEVKQPLEDDPGTDFTCDYCTRDISHEPRVRCTVCENFDLCIDCFCAGVEILQHKKDHPYKIVERMEFPLFSPEWSAEEEFMLLEGIEMFGIGNWSEADHISTKSTDECKKHYFEVYFSGPNAPLPDKEQLLSTDPDHLVKAIRTVKKDDSSENATALNIDNCPKKEFSQDEIKAGYNPLRQEFDPPWEGTVENLLQDITYSPDDSERDMQMKDAALNAYRWVLTERERRRQIIKDRNLIAYLQYQEMDKSIVWKVIRDMHSQPKFGEFLKYICVFNQFMSRSDFEAFLNRYAHEQVLLSKMEEIRIARSRGLTSRAEIDRYESDLMKREQHLLRDPIERQSLRPSAQCAPYVKPYKRDSPKKPFKVALFPKANLLNDDELQMLEEIRLTPQAYLTIKTAVVGESALYGGITMERIINLAGLEPSQTEKIVSYFTRTGLIKMVSDRDMMMGPSGCSPALIMPSASSMPSGSFSQSGMHKKRHKKHKHHTHKEDK